MTQSVVHLLNKKKEIIDFLHKIRITDEFKDNWQLAIGFANVELGFRQFISGLEQHIKEKKND